jgi:hypothetical protein
MACSHRFKFPADTNPFDLIAILNHQSTIAGSKVKTAKPNDLAI